MQHQFVIVIALAMGSRAWAAPPGAARDIDGDGFDDLVIGAPGEWISVHEWAGVAHVLFGSPNGISAQGDELWHQNKAGIRDRAEFMDEFSRDMALGDFNGDGLSDLAIGAFRESFEGPGIAEGGIVHVLYATTSGLDAAGAQVFSQATAGVSDARDADDEFGGAMASADFDHDGFDDLAIGVAGENVGGMAGAGAVHILHGGPAGLSADREQFWHRDRDGIEEEPEAGDDFGRALAVGDFDGDGFFDLAISADNADAGSVEDAGVVHVLYGSNSGLGPDRSQVWHQDSPGVLGRAESGDIFGRALIAGDFNGDGADDLAVAVPGQDVNGVGAAGAVHVFFGSGNGLNAAGDQIWHQAVAGIQGTPQNLDFLGESVAAGDFNNDGFFDLAIGVPNDRVGGFTGGTVHVLFGSSDGLTAADARYLSQDSPGMDTDPANGERFGDAVVAGDFNSDGFYDLAIGVSAETDLGGAVHVVYGSASGPRLNSSRFFHQDTPGIAETADGEERFGYVLGN